MALLDIAHIEQEGIDLIVVFLPPETSAFDDVRRERLRDLLIKALVREGITGELLGVWEWEGALRFMGAPHWADFVAGTTYAELYGRRTAQITC